MTPTRYWITSIALDAAVAGLVVTAALGDTLADLLMLTLVGAVIIGRAASAFVCNSSHAAQRPAGFLIYHVIAETALIAGLWAIDYPVIAAGYLIALLAFEFALLRDPAAEADNGRVPA